MELTSEELRAQIEAALRALAPAPYQRVEEGDYFLSIANPMGKSGDLDFKEIDGQVELEFGPSGTGWEFQLVSVVRGILDETLFSARYKAFILPVGGIFPVSEFETLRKRKKFESLSWKGTYTIKGEAEKE